MAVAPREAGNGDDGQDWARDVGEVFRAHDIQLATYVPDAGLARLIDYCHADETMTAAMLTTEEEGIGMIAGAWLGGQRGVLLMQSSGVGNCINTLSLITSCRMPFLSIVTMRGEWGEFNPWQVAMGQATQATLEASGVIVYRVDDASEMGETVDAAARFVYDSTVPATVLLSQRAIGRKRWK
jgi:sulfopyruvate decarboxylase alpha subunit